MNATDIPQVNCIDNLDFMRVLPDDFVDLIVTSPPYPNTRGFGEVRDWFPFMRLRFGQMFRILKPTGVLVLNVCFPSNNGCFPEAELYIPEWLCNQYGAACIDFYIWVKPNPPPTGNLKRRDVRGWESVFVFALSPDYKFNPVRKPYAAKSVGKLKVGNKTRSEGVGHSYAGGHSNQHPDGARQTNVLIISSSGDQNRPRAQGGSFPRALPRRFILQHTDKGDVVFDPFAGVFTTVVEARDHGRIAFGCDTDPKECDSGETWLAGAWQPWLINTPDHS